MGHSSDWPVLKKAADRIMKGGATGVGYGPIGKEIYIRAEINSIEPNGRFTVTVEGTGKSEEAALQQFYRKVGELNGDIAGIIAKRA